MSTANSAVPEPRLHERSTYDVIENLRAMARARSARVILSLVVALVIVDFANSLSVPLPEYESFLSKLESERPSASLQEEATRAVLARLLPLHLDSFDFRIISKVKYCPYSQRRCVPLTQQGGLMDTHGTTATLVAHSLN